MFLLKNKKYVDPLVDGITLGRFWMIINPKD
jgi:hypothetical protein